MVKVRAPALSLDASGSLAGAIVFSKWKGRNYVRQLVIPANPKSVKQVSVRAMFKFLSQEWTNNSVAMKATWNDMADDAIISPFNAYMGYNQDRWRNGLTPCRDYPPSATAGVGNITFTSATGGIRMATLVLTTATNQDHFGALIARSTTTGFTPGFENLIGLLRCWGHEAHSYVDTPLVADTYYYRTRWFDDGGNPKAIWEAEKSAVVTDT